MTSVGVERAEKLYDRVFVEYGDDSVAQLGGVHLACEQASQLLAKAFEWGRLAATSSNRLATCATTTCPADAGGRPSHRSSRRRDLEPTYREYLDEVFGLYGEMFEPMYAWYERRFPQDANDADFVYRSTITAKTCDTLRVCLPAATRSNVGIYATAQSYEQLLMRLSVDPLAEMREYGELMLEELRKLIPAFLKRVDVEDRGVAWARYWRGTRGRASRSWR